MELWETKIHTLDVGQGDSSLIQIKNLGEVADEDAFLLGYKQDNQEEIWGMDTETPCYLLRPKFTYYFIDGRLWDTVWEYNILIDGGEAGQEEKILHCINTNVKNGLDAVLITHADKDHYGGIYMMLVKNNFWHVCKVILITVGQFLADYLRVYYECGAEGNEPEEEAVKQQIKTEVEKVVGSLLDFETENVRDSFIVQCANAFTYIRERIFNSWPEFAEEIVGYLETQDEYMPKILYDILIEDTEIKRIVGLGRAGEGCERHASLPLGLEIFLSGCAFEVLFGEGEWKKKEVYEGKRVAEDISVKANSEYFAMYGVNRQIWLLTVKNIGMDFMEEAEDMLNPDIAPVKMILAAVDRFADCGGEKQICGDENVKNCCSIAILLQMGGFLYYSGGDLPWDGETAIAKNLRDGKYGISVPEEFKVYKGFKVGHHGSETATSNDFLALFSPGYAVISCGDHTPGSGRQYGFPAKETVYRLMGNGVIPVFSTAYPQIDAQEKKDIEGKVIVTGYAAPEDEGTQYNQSGDMICSIQVTRVCGEPDYVVQMEFYEGEGEECKWRTYPLFRQSPAEEEEEALEAVQLDKTPFVLIPGVLEFEDIRPIGEGVEGFTAEFMLGSKILSARFVNLSKWRCYEGRLTVSDHQVLSLGDMLQWAGALFPNLQIFSEQEEWKLDNLGIDSVYLYWNAWLKCVVTMKWHGKVTVGALDFYITFEIPEYRMELELRPNQKLTLEDCLEKAGMPAGALGFFGRTGLEGLTLRVLPLDKSCNMKLCLSTERVQNGGGSFGELELRLGFRKKYGVQAGMKGNLCIGGMSVRFSAFYEDGDWTLSGEMGEQDGISLAAVLACVAKEAGAAEPFAFPADFRLSYAAVDIGLKERDWALQCGGKLAVSGTEVDMGLSVRVQKDGGQRELSVTGTAELLGVDFACVFEKVKGQSATLFYIKKETGITLDLQELVRLFDESVTLPVDVKLLMREAAALHLPSGGMVFQAVLGGELELSLQKIPVIGGFLPERADFKLDGIKVGYVQTGGEGEKETETMAEAGRILTGNGLSDLPEQLAGGFFMEITADVGGEKIAYLLGGRAKDKPAEVSDRKLMEASEEKGLLVQGAEDAEPSPEPAVTKSFAVNKKLGPLELHRITIMMSDGKLWFTPEVTVSMGCFLVDFTDVSMGISLAEHTVSARMNGMGLSYQQTGLTLAAGFGKTDDKAMLYRYDGTLSVQASKWQLMGMGSYGKLRDGTVSFYLFLDASMRIVLHPSLILTGVMAGAGINKSLRVPDIGEVEKFPLLAGGSSPLSVFDDLNRNWLVSREGRDWLAVGVRFRIAELLDGQALLMANLGGELEFDLLGLFELELPGKSRNPYLHIALQLRADLKPASGVFSVEIAVGKSSYLLCPDCHITGGAAFYTWFAPSEHHGDFVVTVGGYHPAFAVPAHYPKVDRVGIAWQVSKEVSLKGEAYFALTPSCAMAGANLSITYEKGNLKAWFAAWANLLVAWKPFHFLADIGVNLGVSYRMNLLFCHKTLSVSIGGSLRLWGPPTGGQVKIHLWFISFTIGFGADEEGADNHRPLLWNEFRELLPEGDAIQIHPAAGLESQSENGIWLVRGKDFRFTVEGSVPASSIAVGQNVHKTQGGTVHIRPMNLTEVDTGMKIQIIHKATNGGAEKDFSIVEKRQRVAESLWGAPLYRDGKFVQSDSVPTAGLLDGHLTGAEFMPRSGGQGTEVVIDDLDAISVLQKAGKERKVSLRLVDYRLPALKAGQYEIRVEQGVRKAGQIQETFPSKVQSFYVGGCRFAWKKEMVVNTYPPRGSTGSFTNALPHVVLADSMLPWERQYGAEEKTPWLALFLLRRDEIEPGENGDGTRSMPVDEFCRQAAGVARPALEKEPGVDGASLCSVLTMSADIYRAILPSEEELCLLCHGRDTELSGRTEDFGNCADEGGFSVIMANRMPGTGEYTGYLVSLEGAEALEKTEAGKVQLLCMDSFTFHSTEAEAEDFYHMAVMLLQNNRGSVDFGSGMEEDCADGYCLVRCHTGDGTVERKRFRGMLKPVGAEDTQDELSMRTAVSMGRMLALGQSDFITGMLQYRERMSELVSRMMRLRDAGDVQKSGESGLADSRDVFRAIRGVDDSIMNLLRPVSKEQWLDGGGKRMERRRPEAVYGVNRWMEEEPYKTGRRRADEVCRCLENGRNLKMAGAEEPEMILNQWLENLLLLKGLPFACLLPTEKLIPPESVRFFQVDKAWLLSMASGAAGIGENSRKQEGVTQNLYNSWKQRIEREKRYGVLLRSHMLRLWKNMAVYVCDEAGKEVEPLRMERLSEDILLILSDVPLAALKLREPSEGIRMQFNEDGTIHPRNPGTFETGSGTLAPGEQWKWFRDNGRRILNVAGERGLAGMFTEYFGKENLPGGKLTPAGFALQFIEGTRSVVVQAGQRGSCS